MYFVVLNFPACGKSFDPHVEQKTEVAQLKQKQQQNIKNQYATFGIEFRVDGGVFRFSPLFTLIYGKK